MLAEILADYVDLSSDELRHLLSLPADRIYNDPLYLNLVQKIDVNYLERTLNHAHSLYTAKLPGFRSTLMREYGVEMAITPYTLGEWLLGYLKEPERLYDMQRLNLILPARILWQTLPGLINLLEDMPEGRQAWQHALATVMIPLSVSHRAYGTGGW